jgi:hypothetical protein
MVASVNPFCRGSRGWSMLNQQNHAVGGANGSIIVGMFVCLCLPSKKPSEREFFVLAGMDFNVKLLRTRIASVDRSHNSSRLPMCNSSTGLGSPSPIILKSSYLGATSSLVT